MKIFSNLKKKASYVKKEDAISRVTEEAGEGSYQTQLVTRIVEDMGQIPENVLESIIWARNLPAEEALDFYEGKRNFKEKDFATLLGLLEG